MEENTNNYQTQPVPEQQTPDKNQVPQEPVEEQNQVPQQQESEQKSKGLLPGQEHEDELDYMGAAMFRIFGKGFSWIKNLISPRKT